MSRLRWPIAALACLPLALTALRLSGVWPCETACQGGGRYQAVFGIPVLWPAAAVYGLLALSALRDAWRGPDDWSHRTWSHLTCALAGTAAGGALFFLWVAWSLGMACTFCFSVHAATLLTLFAVAAEAAGTTFLALVLSALALNAAYHHRVEADVEYVPVTGGAGSGAPSTDGTTSSGNTTAGTTSGSTTGATGGSITSGTSGGTATTSSGQPGSGTTATLSPAAQRADANRTRGHADAPLTIDYGYSLQCSHCAEQHGPLLDTLGPAIAAGRVRLILRPIVRPSDPSSRWLARWSFAAAAQSPTALDRFLIERLDTRADLSREDLLKLGGDLPALDAASAGGTFDPLVDADQRALAGLGYRGATPFVVVQRGATVVAKFARDVPLDQLMATIATSH
jgi:protein-disulfide isomerase/uncharacterized membrane protein